MVHACVEDLPQMFLVFICQFKLQEWSWELELSLGFSIIAFLQKVITLAMIQMECKVRDTAKSVDFSDEVDIDDNVTDTEMTRMKTIQSPVDTAKALRSGDRVKIASEFWNGEFVVPQDWQGQISESTTQSGERLVKVTFNHQKGLTIVPQRQADSLRTVKESEQSIWIEHTDKHDRTYYYNTVTKTSSWERPAELQKSSEPISSDTEQD